MSTTEDHKEAQVYEVGYLVLPSIPEEKLPEVVSTIESAITKNGGKTLDGEAPFKRNLAYAISKTIGASKYVVNDAYVGWLKFETSPDKVEKIKSALEKVEQIIRFLLIKAPRESVFTFAKAREAQRIKDMPEEEVIDESVPVADEIVVE